MKYAARSIDRRPTTRCAKDRRQKCPRQDSNLYAVSGTGPSNQPVYQFQHVGEAPNRLRYGPRLCGAVLGMLEEGLEPSRG